MCWEILNGREQPTEWTLDRANALGALQADWAWRSKFKDHTVRGIEVLKGAQAAGESSRGAREETEPILEFMDERVMKGASIRNAARLARQRGLGTSIEANRKLYGRHRK